jgi:hypothetical protein
MVVPEDELLLVYAHRQKFCGTWYKYLCAGVKLLLHLQFLLYPS